MCFSTCRDPRLRPSFAEIMAALKPLQKPISSQAPRPPAGRGPVKGQPSRIVEDPPADQS